MQQLRHFLTIVELDSIGRAAEALNISQPGLSRSIRALEDTLGIPVFERRPRGVKLTDFGQLLVPRAQVICNEHDRAVGEARALRGLRAGDVQLGLHSVAGAIGATQALDRFMARHPTISIGIITGSGSDLAAKVASAEIDIAFTLFADDLRDAAFVYEDLFVLPCRIYQRAEALASIDDAGSLAELADRSWALAGTINFRDTFEAAFRDLGSAAPTRFVQCSSLDLLLDLVLTRDLLTIIPDRVASSPRYAGRLAAATIAAPGGHPRGGLIYRPGALKNPTLRTIADAFRALSLAIADG